MRTPEDRILEVNAQVHLDVAPLGRGAPPAAAPGGSGEDVAEVAELEVSATLAAEPAAPKSKPANGLPPPQPPHICSNA